MAIITTYPDDSAASSGDKYLTVDEDGSTKLTTLATLVAAILVTDSITTTMIEDDTITAAKIDFTSIMKRKNASSTATLVGNILIQFGWDSVQGPGGTTTNVTKTVTFPQAFSGTPIVMASYAGGSSSPITDLPSATTTGSSTSNRTGGASAVSTSGFNAVVADSNNLSTGVYHAFTWIAIGPA